MVTVKQCEDDYCLMKHSATSELSKCPSLDLQGTRVPIFMFGSQSSLDSCAYGGIFNTLEKQSLLDLLLLAQWEDRAWKGLFNYDVTTCEMKVTNGLKKFVTQLNEERSVLNYLPVLKEKGVRHQLYPIIHNCKIPMEEFLFAVTTGEKALPKLIQSASVPEDVNLSIIINANPVDYGHVFLLPSGYCGLSRILDSRLLEMVTRFALEINNCSFRIFYDFSASNSNQQCVQACYLAIPLPVESMPVATLSGNWGERGLHISEVTDYPIKALSFKGYGNLKLLVEVVSEICSCLQKLNNPYSLLITDFGTNMMLFPQNTCCSLSALECGGHFVFKTKHEFDQASEEALLKRLADASLGNEDFLSVKQLCFRIADQLSCSKMEHA
ncbi:hypothetical protein IFM89_017612 [Coptis chinensis]|uniref:GDP-L-galactose phosphorylase 1 n=1 Tax=Coptis chinensis TaxID=261450 RepID=A0A835GZS8_9MAGN|nr:hypothetical protein IFM89_017612 [Coptis chinensis]